MHAERDAVIKAVHVQPGGQIDAKDLLVEFERLSAMFSSSSVLMR